MGLGEMRGPRMETRRGLFHPHIVGRMISIRWRSGGDGEGSGPHILGLAAAGLLPGMPGAEAKLRRMEQERGSGNIEEQIEAFKSLISAEGSNPYKIKEFYAETFKGDKKASRAFKDKLKAEHPDDYNILINGLAGRWSSDRKWIDYADQYGTKWLSRNKAEEPEDPKLEDAEEHEDAKEPEDPEESE